MRAATAGQGVAASFDAVGGQAEALHALGPPAGSEHALGRLYVESLTNALCHQLIEHHAPHAPRIAAPGRALTGAVLARLDAYLEAAADEAVTLETLAGLANLSVFHFARRFKAAYPLNSEDQLLSLFLPTTTVSYGFLLISLSLCVPPLCSCCAAACCWTLPSTACCPKRCCSNSSRSLAVTTLSQFAPRRPGGTIDFWRLAQDPFDPRRVELVKTGYSVPVTRGLHSMVIVR